MTNHHVHDLTILFADVAGSVEIYETLGDALAYEKILQYLGWMTDIIDVRGGRVVETIGDEIMCVFSNANDAVIAACSIHECLAENGALNRVRIGMHRGSTPVEDEHPYGDTVNVAARMTDLAKGGKILVTAQTMENLSAQNRQICRKFGSVELKGKQHPIPTYEVLWSQDDNTLYRTPPPKDTQRAAISRIKLCYQGEEIVLDSSKDEFIMGRGEQADLIVSSDAVSRVHASLKLRHGIALLLDQSTNGTFIKKSGGRRDSDGFEFFLHRDECYLNSKGVLSLGEAKIHENPHRIYFDCLTE